MTPKGIVAALVALAVGLVAGIVLGGVGLASDLPSDTSVDAGFARDMQSHHDQAVQMSLIVRDRSEDPEVRQLAYDIARTQGDQAGQMAGWLQSWGLTPTGSQPVMAWMAGHEHGGSDRQEYTDSTMPGMADQEELDALQEASGRAADVLFLRLMIRHHQGGVPMAEAAVAGADRPEVRRLAQTIIDSQTAEVETMTSMLEERGGEPLPAP